MICTPNTGHLVWGYFYALDLLSQVKKLAQHSNSIFAICNSQLLPTNQICGLLSYPKKTKNPNPSPIGNRFGFFLFGGRGWIAQAAHLKKPLRGFFAAGTDSGGRCCSNPPATIPLICFYKTETPAPGSDTGVLGRAKQPKSEPLPSGASLAAISSKVMVFVPSL